MTKKPKSPNTIILTAEYIWEQINLYVPKYVMLNFKYYYPQLDDIKSDVFYKLFKSQRYDPTLSKISTYLLNITRYHILDLIKNEKRRKEKGYIYINKSYLYEDNSKEHIIDPVDLDSVELKTHIKTILNNLTRIEKFITEEKFFKHKSNKYIYNFLRIDSKKFNRYYNRLVLKLRDVFENNDFIINYCIENNIQFDELITENDL